MPHLPGSALRSLAATALAAALLIVPPAEAQPIVPPAGAAATDGSGLPKPAAAPSAVGDRFPYQNMVTSKCGTADCVVPLVKVPAKWRIELRNVSCFSIMRSNSGFYWFGLRNNRSAGGIWYDYMTPTKMVYVSGANDSYWSMNTQVLSYAVAGDTLSIHARGNGALQSVHCKVSGEWIYTG